MWLIPTLYQAERLLCSDSSEPRPWSNATRMNSRSGATDCCSEMCSMANATASSAVTLGPPAIVRAYVVRDERLVYPPVAGDPEGRYGDGVRVTGRKVAKPISTRAA